MISCDQFGLCVGFPAAGYPLSRVGLSLSRVFPFSMFFSLFQVPFAYQSQVWLRASFSQSLYQPLGRSHRYRLLNTLSSPETVRVGAPARNSMLVCTVNSDSLAWIDECS